MADHGTQHHHDDSHKTGEMKSKTAFRSSFWFVIILVGVFIAALNFIKVEGGESEGHGNHEATSNETLKGESGLGRPTEAHTEFHGDQTAHDTVHRENNNN